jgi:fimbrial chaperone protein
MRKGLLFFFLILTLTSYDAGAFKFAPFAEEFAPVGPESKQTYTVSNDSNQKIAVEISAKTREFDAKGREINNPADDDFVIYPDLLALDPNSEKRVSVQWIGDFDALNARLCENLYENADKVKKCKAGPNKELPYRITAEQLPVSIEKPEDGKAHIAILLNYSTSAMVTPEGAEANVIVQYAGKPRFDTEIDPELKKKLKDKLEIVVENIGTKHQYMRKYALYLDKKYEYNEGDLPGLDKSNILAGHTKRFHIDWPEDLPKKEEFDASIEFKK